jgi:sirohydrochlorin ferrochelatase
MKTALLLIAHGSRQDEANADLRHVVEQLRRLGRFAIVEPCFLELAAPDIDAGAVRCVEQGAEKIVLVPYFLSTGVHVLRDLTTARDRLAERYRQVDIRLAEPLGRHPKLIEVVVERAAAAEIP